MTSRASTVDFPVAGLPVTTRAFPSETGAESHATRSRSAAWKADLRGAELQEANLDGAQLQEAVLIGTQLQGADLRGANLDGAHLEGANLENVKCLSSLAATRIPGIAAAVGYYGGAVAEFVLEPPQSPVLLHFGETDPSIPKDHWDTIRAAHPKIRMHIYPGAGHGFNCEQCGSYDAASARLARERTMAFLKQHVG